MIEAKIILDSISNKDVRLTTFELSYPRFILAEFNTHRVFSRNSASSRAIPVKKLISDILNDPVVPVFWGKNQPGMQAKTQLSGFKLFLSKRLWKMASYNAIVFAYALQKIGLHKQIANRIIEPWMHTKTIVTSTEWSNFFELRNHPDAQPEFRVLAEEMFSQLQSSTPKQLKYGEWHLPYVTEDEKKNNTLEVLLKMSVARCARVSYLTHDGKIPNIDSDVELHNRLVGSVPIHASPTEHQATPTKDVRMHKNYRGWKQYRDDVELKLEKGE